MKLQRAERDRVLRALSTLKLPIDSDAVGHVHCGLHSGIPLCCIAFYITVSRLTDNTAKALEQAGYKAIAGGRWWSLDYIPCPRCVLDRRFAAIKPCDCSVTGAALDAELAVIAKERKRGRKWIASVTRQRPAGAPVHEAVLAAFARTAKRYHDQLLAALQPRRGAK